MKNMEASVMKNTTNFEDILTDKYGKKGTPAREKYDADSFAFRLGIMLKEARQEAKITQEELAIKTGTKKAISQELKEGRVIFRYPHSTNSLKLDLVRI